MNDLEKMWKNSFATEKCSIYIDDRVFEESIYDLSIIVPVYNAEKYLLFCLESLSNQNSKYNYEVILIDDGSVDSSYEICYEFCKNLPNFNLIKQINGGASSARNHGIKVSKGKYLCFVDSDDTIDSSFVEIMLDSIILNDADYVKCGYCEFDSSTGKILKKVKLKNSVYNKNNCYKKELKGHACMCVFKRELLKNIQFPEGYWYEDIIIKFIIMALCNKIITIDSILYNYRVNIDSTSNSSQSKKSLKCLSQMYLIMECVNFYNKLNLPKNKNFYKNYFFESFSMLWLRCRNLGEEELKKVFDANCEYYISNVNNSFHLSGFKLQRIILKYKCFNFWKIISLFKYIVNR